MESYDEPDVVRSRSGAAPGVLSNSIVFELLSIGNKVEDILLSKRWWMKRHFQIKVKKVGFKLLWNRKQKV